MKLLFLCHSLNIGGLETYILRFSRWLTKTHPCYSMHLVCKSGIFGPYETDFRETGVELHSMPLGYINPLQYFMFYRFLRYGRFDAVCDFGGDFGALPVACASVANVPQRLVFYRNARNSYNIARYKLLYQYFLNRTVRIFSTHILSNSQDAFDHYYRKTTVINDSRFHIVRNGVSVSPALPYSEKSAIRQTLGILPDQKIALHVGSGRWEKNHRMMFALARTAQDDNKNICFVFAGADVEKTFGEDAKSSGLRNVRFLGERRDVPNLLQIADLFLFPSLSEGQPNALIEAINSGLPFIASNIAPIKESLPRDWGDRWLFSPDNQEQGYSLLKEHLVNNLRNEQQFKGLVEWSIANYNEDKQFGKFLSCLTS